MKELINCNFDRSQYIIINGQYACPHCDEGFYLNEEGGCSPCDIENCEECFGKENCEKCLEGFMLNFETTECVPEFSNCEKIG